MTHNAASQITFSLREVPSLVRGLNLQNSQTRDVCNAVCIPVFCIPVSGIPVLIELCCYDNFDVNRSSINRVTGFQNRSNLLKSGNRTHFKNVGNYSLRLIKHTHWKWKLWDSYRGITTAHQQTPLANDYHRQKRESRHRVGTPRYRFMHQLGKYSDCQTCC